MVGTAFDYLLRFYIKNKNPNAIEHEWVAMSSLRLLEYRVDDPLFGTSIYKKTAKIIHEAKKVYEDFINKGEINSNLLKITLLLGQIDIIYIELDW
ncbi:hypothetical protein TDSAC_0758 [Thermodesulfobium acidiphilum]|uniref:Uncharacterized protein n=1 Tax=Thermodesulfobium acidiphilum TaxID=1794699 RepID=A0A2R4VZY8_THEAF|nr:hypothetical protein [Thermodesulfobium acidiphilum]AWB10121.1 hypothetical protein TDSAC_0758 [Thermodesulfobium acidiphilum]